MCRSRSPTRYGDRENSLFSEPLHSSSDSFTCPRRSSRLRRHHALAAAGFLRKVNFLLGFAGFKVKLPYGGEIFLTVIPAEAGIQRLRKLSFGSGGVRLLDKVVEKGRQRHNFIICFCIGY